MNDIPLSADDPRITAYALGELADEERALVEAALRADPGLRGTIGEIRAAAKEIESALAREVLAEETRPAIPAVAAFEQEKVLDIPGQVASTTPYRAPETPGSLLRVPRLYFIAAGLAAAGFAVLVALYRDTHDAKQLAAREAAREGQATAQEASRGSGARPAAPIAPAIGVGLSARFAENAFVSPVRERFSIVPLRFDARGYARLRQQIEQGVLPGAAEVRIEDLLNHFPYRYASPQPGAPIAASLEVASAPWSPGHRLVRIGLKSRSVPAAEGPPANAVRLIGGAESLNAEEANRGRVTIAREVSVRVEFNPQQVVSYRLIGYESGPARPAAISAEISDTIDLVAGQTVTALYEIVPADPIDERGGEARMAGRSLRPQASLLTVQVGYREPGDPTVPHCTLDFSLQDSGVIFAQASADFRFAAAVAQFGLILRGSAYRGTGTMGDVVAWAAAATLPGGDPGGYRAGFIEVARKAQRIIQ